MALVSNDKDAFESYGLDGAANAGIGYEAAEGYTRALNALIKNQLFPGQPTSMRVGETLFVFWARRPEAVADLMVLSEDNPENVKRFLESVERGNLSQGLDAEQLLAAFQQGMRLDISELPLAEHNSCHMAWTPALRRLPEEESSQAVG